MPNVSNLVKTIQDIMRKDAGARDGYPAAIRELETALYKKAT